MSKRNKEKDFLRQAYVLDRQMKLIQEKIDKIMSMVEYKSPSFDGGSGGRTSADQKLTSALAKAETFEAQMKELRADYITKYLEIEEAIREVDDLIEREVLTRRYLFYESWKSKFDKKTGEYVIGIAEKMGYSEQEIYRKHGKALKKIRISEKMRVNESE